jgi:FtsP/CotA-like multicopper oxidase with cupredoxin domain
MRRREFVKLTAMAGAATLFPWQRAYAAYAQSPALIKFGAGQKLRLFGIDIPLAVPVGTPYPGVDYYEIAMRQYTDTLHPALGPTTLRGYTNAANVGTQKHLEGAILAQVNRPVRIRWSNQLPATMPTPTDPSLVAPYTFGQSLGEDRAAPHLHGGLVPWPSDGGPFHWFSNGGAVKGPSVVNWLPDALGNLTDDYWYPNVQTPRFMWYHDHAVGITRTNPYLGLASGYILTDPSEGLLPSAGPTLMKMLSIPEGDLTRQVHLVVQDKIFAGSSYNGNDPNNLWYPDVYDPQFFGAPAAGFQTPLPTPSLVPEFWGDTMLMNGTVFPYIDVEPRRYRFRILNACNTRVLSLRLVGALGRPFPLSAEPDLAKPVPTMTLIGTEGGFLDGTLAPKGVVYNNTAAMPLVLAPAERADIVIDFFALQNAAGRGNGPVCLLLHNDAPVPFPGGTPLADFYPGNKKLAMPPAPGYGPNTRTLLQFRVYPLGTLTGDTNPDPAPDPAWTLPPAPAPAQTVPGTRDLALYETFDAWGRLAQNLGTLAGPAAQLDPATEIVQAGTVEVWRIFNTTADTHPIHFHYFNVRVVSRQAFSLGGGLPNLTGQLLPPDPAEQGWKETVKFNPGECTTLLVEMPTTGNLAPAGATIPNSPRGAVLGTAGHEYVWHCHILEHEEHDMMRPLVVLP